MPSLLLFILYIINIMTNKTEIKVQFSRFLIIKWNMLHTSMYVCLSVFVCVQKTVQFQACHHDIKSTH